MRCPARQEAHPAREGEVGVEEEEAERVLHLHDEAVVGQVGGHVEPSVERVLEQRHGRAQAAQDVLHVAHTWHTQAELESPGAHLAHTGRARITWHTQAELKSRNTI